MKEEEIEKGDCSPGLLTRSLFLRFCQIWTKQFLINLQTRAKRVSRIHQDGPVVYSADAFDSHFQGD